jgi:hypothetical protein
MTDVGAEEGAVPGDLAHDLVGASRAASTLSPAPTTQRTRPSSSGVPAWKIFTSALVEDA